MKLKSHAIISGLIESISAAGIILTPDFDTKARIHVLFPVCDAEKYKKLLIAGDKISIQGELAMNTARSVEIISTKITRQCENYSPDNFISITARSKSVSYSLHTTDLFHAEFEAGIFGTRRIDFYIDRSLLDTDALRDFALNNQYRPYAIAGRLELINNKIAFVAGSIARV